MSRETSRADRVSTGAIAVRLPVGLSDEEGRTYPWAMMRPARGIDELKAMSDFRVWLRPQSFPAVLLARVVEVFAREPVQDALAQGGRVPEGLTGGVDVGRLEALDVADFRALEDAYRELNGYAVHSPEGLAATSREEVV